jgi:hypothetical protein
MSPQDAGRQLSGNPGIVSLKVFTNEKRGGLRVTSLGLPVSFYRGNFQKILCRPHPVRGIKPLSEHLFLLFANNN